MAKKTDVKLEVQGGGLDPHTPIGVTITYQVGAIPTAAIDFAPLGPNVIKIENAGQGLLEKVDKYKREEVTIDIEVKTYVGAAAGGGNSKKTRGLTFRGLLDGLTVGNLVGGNSYQAIIKNKAQYLLELTISTPGLTPTSVNIYKNPDFSVVHKGGYKENTLVTAWGRITDGEVKMEDHPIKLYKKLLELIIKKQKDGWKEFVGLDRLTSGKDPFKDIFESKYYKKALDAAEKIWEKIDIDKVSNGAIKAVAFRNPSMNTSIKEVFTSGPNIFLESFMNFLGTFNCSMIFTNDGGFVVPINSILKPEEYTPKPQTLQKEPNKGGPADYNGYSYNDNGYRDIGSVVVTTAGYKGGNYLGGVSFDRGACEYFTPPEDQSNASGVHVVRAHKFMAISPTYGNKKDGEAKGVSDADKTTPNLINVDQTCEAAQSEAKEAQETVAKDKNEEYKDFLSKILKNFAETRFYQERFRDRSGSITFDFNPQWVPGTGGQIFIKETGMTLAFYVTAVTHRIDLSPPMNGSAITVVNYVCGRLGKPGTVMGPKEDTFLGYNTDKEKDIQKGFMEGNEMYSEE